MGETRGKNHSENLTVTKEGREGWDKLEAGVDTYTLLCTK